MSRTSYLSENKESFLNQKSSVIEIVSSNRSDFIYLMQSWKVLMGNLKPQDSWIYKLNQSEEWTLRIEFRSRKLMTQNTIDNIRKHYPKTFDLGYDFMPLIRRNGDMITYYQGDSLFDVFLDEIEVLNKEKAKQKFALASDNPGSFIQKRGFIRKLSYINKIRIVAYPVIEILSMLSFVADHTFGSFPPLIGLVEPFYYMNGMTIPLIESIILLIKGYYEFCNNKITKLSIFKQLFTHVILFFIMNSYLYWVQTNDYNITSVVVSTIILACIVYSLFLFFLNNTAEGDQKHRNPRIIGMIVLIIIFSVLFGISEQNKDNSTSNTSFFNKFSNSVLLFFFFGFYLVVIIILMLYSNLRDYGNVQQLRLIMMRRKAIKFLITISLVTSLALSLGQIYLENMYFKETLTSQYGVWFYPGIPWIYNMMVLRKMTDEFKIKLRKRTIIIQLILAEIIALAFDMIIFNGIDSFQLMDLSEILNQSYIAFLNMELGAFLIFLFSAFDEYQNHLKNQTDFKAKIWMLVSFCVLQLYLFLTNKIFTKNAFVDFILLNGVSFVDGGIMPIGIFFYLLYSDYKLSNINYEERKAVVKRSLEIKEILPELLDIKVNRDSLNFTRSIGKSSILGVRNVLIWFSLIPVIYHLISAFYIQIPITECFYVNNEDHQVPITTGQCCDCMQSSTFTKNLWAYGPGLPIAIHSLVFLFLVFSTLRRLKILHKYRVILLGAGLKFIQPRLNEKFRFFLMIFLLFWLGFFNYVGIKNPFSVDPSNSELNCPFLEFGDQLYLVGSDNFSYSIQQIVAYMAMFSLIYLELRNSTLRFFKEGEHIELLKYPIEVKYEMDVGPSLRNLEEIRRFFLSLSHESLENKVKIIIGHFYEQNILRVIEGENKQIQK